MIELINNILSAKIPSLSPPPLKFEITPEAVAYSNFQVLLHHKFDLQRCITAENTICTPGSEFRDITLLDPLLENHPLWPTVKRSITEGVSMYLFHEPDEEQRSLENNELISRHNHKSAKLNPEVITNSLSQEIIRGYAFVIPIDEVHRLPSAMVCPLGIVEQTSLSHDGSRKIKRRLTHDQSFSALPTSESLNKLTDLSQYPNLIYGFCLPRIILQIISLRHHYPRKRIMISKYDFAKAYRRLHYKGPSAYKCISRLDSLAYIMLRLSFGGSGCPQAWCPVSEMITDFANDLLYNSAWDSKLLHSPDQHLLPPAEYLSPDLQISPALPTMLLPPPLPKGFSDVFIDDIVTTFLDTPENIARAPAAVPLATHVFTRPLAEDEHVVREKFIAQDKLAAEGNPSEIKTILGWIVNTRLLLISLPSDKYTVWCDDITSISKVRHCKRKTLEQLIGRLNHTSLIIPTARFYLGPLRFRLSKGKHDNSTIFFNSSDDKLLQLWLHFLHLAHKGINLNLTTLRQPTNIIITDACPAGLGGYSIRSGKAWRYQIPTNINTTTISNNSFEFLASVVGILTEQENNFIPPFGNVLALTDNSSCACWLHRNSFNKIAHPTNTEIATTLAHSCITNSFSIHPQHIPGSSNNIADALSRRHLLTDSELTSFLLTSHPEQIPKNFEILPLSPGLISWIYSTLVLEQSLLTREQRQPTKKWTAAGVDGNATSPISTCNTILTSIPALPSSRQKSAEDSSKLSETALSPKHPEPSLFAQRIRTNYLAGVSVKPLATWLRSSGMLSGRVPSMNLTAQTLSLLESTGYSELGRTPIQIPTKNAPSLRATSASSTIMPPSPTPPCP